MRHPTWVPAASFVVVALVGAQLATAGTAGRTATFLVTVEGMQQSKARSTYTDTQPCGIVGSVASTEEVHFRSVAPERLTVTVTGARVTLSVLPRAGNRTLEVKGVVGRDARSTLRGSEGECATGGQGTAPPRPRDDCGVRQFARAPLELRAGTRPGSVVLDNPYGAAARALFARCSVAGTALWPDVLTVQGIGTKTRPIEAVVPVSALLDTGRKRITIRSGGAFSLGTVTGTSSTKAETGVNWTLMLVRVS